MPCLAAEACALLARRWQARRCRCPYAAECACVEGQSLDSCVKASLCSSSAPRTHRYSQGLLLMAGAGENGWLWLGGQPRRGGAAGSAPRSRGNSSCKGSPGQLREGHGFSSVSAEYFLSSNATVTAERPQEGNGVKGVSLFTGFGCLGGLEKV